MLTIIVPCYNEEETIPLFFGAIEQQRAIMNEEVEYIFVNDGSKDRTIAKIKELVHQQIGRASCRERV